MDVSTCSERFARGVRWLEAELRFDEKRIRSDIDFHESELAKMTEEQKKASLTGEMFEIEF